jgi:hypothetical protein
MHKDNILSFSFPVTQKLAYVQLYKFNSDINKLHSGDTHIPGVVSGWIIFLHGSDPHPLKHDSYHFR